MAHQLNWRKYFPYTPRGKQSSMCDEFETAISNKQVVVIVAPNGFGKTVTSLSVLLSQVQQNKLNGFVFLTRTHRQIDHLVEEIVPILQKNNLNLRLNVLGSRKHLCQNHEVLQKSSIDRYCTKAKRKRYCYPLKFSNQKKISSDILRKNRLFQIPSMDDEDLLNDAPKIGSAETLIAHGCKHKICPYYLSKRLLVDAEIVLCPYPYFFNPLFRKRVGKSIENYALVVDECHNIIDVIEDSLKSSFSLKQIVDFNGILSNISNAYFEDVQRFVKMFAKFIQILEQSYLRGKESYTYSELQHLLKHYNLFNLFEYIHDLDYSQLIEKITQNTVQETLIAQGSTYDKITHFMQLFAMVDEKSFISYFERYSDTLSFIIQDLNISLITNQLLFEKAKLIFMSGTLNSELFIQRFNFNSSNVQKLSYNSFERKINLSILPFGVKKETLCTEYKYRNNRLMLQDYGETIRFIAGYTNGGTIVFFPSYGFKESLLKEWIKQRIVVSKKGQLYFQYEHFSVKIFNDDGGPRSTEIINKYRQYARRKKAVLLACFRSRASEGEDFRNQLSRSIVVIGIPLANYTNKGIKYKIEFYNNQESGLGREWYRNDAMKVVNQGIGRGIRDYRTDYCSVFLLDKRYLQTRFYNLLSDWIRKNKKSLSYKTTPRKSFLQLIEFQKKIGGI